MLSLSTQLVSTLFSGFPPLVIEQVTDESGWILVRAATPGSAVACPNCGTGTNRVHAYHERVVAHLLLHARRVRIVVGVRRLRCPVSGCARQAFREQLHQ